MRWGYVILVLILLLLYSYNERATNFTVVDGDTLKRGSLVFRARYIDAPEVHGQKPWVLAMLPNESCLRYYALKAREVAELTSYVLYKPYDKGKYGRTLASFYYANGSSLELDLVRKGYALCYYRKADILDPMKEKCLSIERKARELSLGMWSCQ